MLLFFDIYLIYIYYINLILYYIILIYIYIILILKILKKNVFHIFVVLLN